MKRKQVGYEEKEKKLNLFLKKKPEQGLEFFQVCQQRWYQLHDEECH
jgi:hypothetical protein